MKNVIFAVILLVAYQVTAKEKIMPKALNLNKAALISEMKLPDFHKFHVKEFAKADGFAMERTISMPKIIDLIVEGKKYRMTNMRLLSVTDRKKPVMWELPQKNRLTLWVGDGIDRSMLKNKDMKKRSLTEKELMSMKLLRQGKERVLSKKDGGIRLMAPLHGGPSCIRCHKDYKKGEFMGAFLYDLNSLGNALNKGENKPEPQTKEEVQNLTKEISLR